MKHFTLMLLVFGLTHTSLAKSSSTITAPLELCQLEQEDTPAQALDVEHIFDIKDAIDISPLHLRLINLYYEENGTTYTFEELKKLFSDEGEEQFNDLYLYEITLKKTGEKFIEVRTYPGDNPVGVIYKVSNQIPVAYNGDGSYEIVTDSGKKYCYDLNK